MKIIIVIVLTAFGTASAIPLKEVEDPEGWFVPTLDGHFKWVSKQQYNKESHLGNRKAVSVEYHLFTKSNPKIAQRLYLNDVNSLKNSNFKGTNPTRFIIHGWQNNIKSDINVELRNALLQTGDYNIISVDWSSAAASLNYASAQSSVSIVGKDVAYFIDFLNSEGGMSFETLELMGHSLGAHICGYAGKFVTKGMIDVITGLDPALPLYSYSDCNTRLCDSDAKYVRTIHTNGGLLGFLQPIGKVSYYPNGGESQPGCGLDLAGFCSHLRSFIYLAELLINDNFTSIKCKDYESAVAKKCEGSARQGKMGVTVDYETSGVYYVPVNKKSLFGTGIL